MKNYEVEVNGIAYQVSLKELTDEEFQKSNKDHKENVAPNKTSKADEQVSDNSEGSTETLAPMPGTILNIHVDVGSKVKEGDVLCILEAMKMENTLVAAQEGTVKEILVNKGEAVEAGQVLIKY